MEFILRRVFNGALSFTVLAAGLSAGALQAESFLVTINTSSVAGTYGHIDLQFNPGNATTQAATADITDFQPYGALLDNTAIQISGDFLGTLPGPLAATNDTPFNDYYEGLTFSSALSFVVTLNGPAIDTPNGTSTAGSTFGVGLYDVNSNSILTDDPGGFAAELDINQDGTITPVSFLNAAGGPSVATIQQAPEPSTFGLTAGFWLTAGTLGLLRSAIGFLPERRLDEFGRRLRLR